MRTPSLAELPRGSWRAAVERALYVAFTALVVNAFAGSISLAVSRAAVSSPLGTVAMGVAFATLGGVTLKLLLRGVTTTEFLFSAVVYVACQYVAGWQTTGPTDGLPDLWWASLGSIALCTLIAGFLPPRRSVPTVLAVAGALLALRLSPIGAPGDTPQVFAEAVQVFAMTSIALFAVPIWRAMGDLADQASAARLAAHHRAERSAVEARLRGAVHRVLHDEVLHALRLVRLPSAARRSTDAVAACHSAAQRLTDDPAPPNSGTEIDLVAAVAGLPTTLDIRLSGVPHCAVAAPVAQALTEATAEALRNVERHAGVPTVRVHITGDGARCTIAVRDDGRGFDRETVPEGHGLALAVRGRLKDAGATVRVSAQPGQGTEVLMTWERTADGAAGALILDELSPLGLRLLIAALAPHSVASLLTAVVFASATRVPALTVSVVLVATLATVIGVAVIRRGPMSAAVSAGLVLTSWLVVALGGWALSTGTPFYDYAAAGAAGPVLSLVAFARPARESIMGAAVTAGLVTFWCYRAGSGWTTVIDSMSAVTAAAIAVTAILLLRKSVQRMRRTIERENDLAGHLAVDRLRVQAWVDRAHTHLEVTRSEVLPFLAAVADGTTDPDGHAVRSDAALLEGAVRDQLHLGRPLDSATRALVRRLRRSGARVEVRGTLPDDAQHPALADLIAGCLGGTAVDRVHLTLTPADDGALRAAVLVSPPPALPRIDLPDCEILSVRTLPSLLLVEASLLGTGSPVREGVRAGTGSS